MLIVVASDSHRNTDILETLVKMYPHADYYLHAGDSERSENDVEPFLTVKGNCDFRGFPKNRIINALDFRIYLFHGHFTRLNLENLAVIAKNHDCNVIIHGHTHVPYYQFYADVHILCPGSVTSPRSMFGASYSLIRINDEKIDIKIKKVNNE